MNNIKYVTGVTVYNISCDDDIIYIDSSASPVTVVLPNIQNSGELSFVNKTFTISDFTNTAAVNNIAIVAAGNTVNSGQATVINSNNGSAFCTIVGRSSWQVTTDNPITDGLVYMGTWNASINDPTLVSSVGIGGHYYIVSVAGTTNLNGITDWNVGDWAVFIDGATNEWQKVDNHDIQSYNFIQDDGNALPQQSVIDFQGAGVTASNGTGKTIVTIAGSPSTNSYGLYAQTANSTPVTATTVETTIIGAGVGTLTVPANGFSIGDSFTCALDGLISCVSSATIHIHVKTLTGVILADTGIITLAAATGKSWIMNLYFTARTLGGAGTASISSGGLFSYIRNGGTQFEGYVLSNINNTTFDTTISNTLIVTAQWNSTDAGNSIVTRNFTLTKIY